MTRPRLPSSTTVWSSVLLEATCTMKPNPVTTIIASESHSTRENENATSPAPKTPAATGMVWLNPRIERRDASQRAPRSAPPPDDVMRNPSVCGPPCRMVPAKIGISTV